MISPLLLASKVPLLSVNISEPLTRLWVPTATRCRVAPSGSLSLARTLPVAALAITDKLSSKAVGSKLGSGVLVPTFR